MTATNAKGAYRRGSMKRHKKTYSREGHEVFEIKEINGEYAFTSPGGIVIHTDEALEKIIEWVKIHFYHECLALECMCGSMLIRVKKDNFPYPPVKGVRKCDD